MRTLISGIVAAVVVLCARGVGAADGNRLAYLNSDSPYYVGRGFPKLITPQWVGEEGVEAVVVLAIDDMRDHRRYEEFLRPILERLKKIDGRAPVSIMTCKIDPETPHLQTWLKEGLSFEAHTADHPCPLLAGGDFARAKGTYDRCIEQMAWIQDNAARAFRMPCCDSLNTPSPRFWAEIFNGLTAFSLRFVEIDSSVFNIMTGSDPEVPRDLVFDADGREKFRKYVPFESFVNTIEDYPYPYIINRFCWEFPCATPSDWQAQYVHKPNNPITTADWKALVDVTVAKKGVMNLVFHPHGWCTPQMVIEVIDHAVAKHGKKVKFLTFREAHECLGKMAGGLRNGLGQDGGIRLMDLNDDGYMDVVIGLAGVGQTRVWSPKEGKWIDGGFPGDLTQAVAQFGVLSKSGSASLLYKSEQGGSVLHFDGTAWQLESTMVKGLDEVFTSRAGKDNGVRLVDLDGDGVCEVVHANGKDNAAYRWDALTDRWVKLPFGLPTGARIVNERGGDAGLRWVDVDEDGRLDVVFGDGRRSLIYLFKDMTEGWDRRVMDVGAGEKGAMPAIVRADGTNNGMWVHSRHLWWQNEDTAKLPNLVDRRAFNDLLKGTEPLPKTPRASLESMKVAAGLKVELVAAEPLVMDPVHISFGPDRKMWVTEMGSYPSDGKNRPSGRVRFLEDLDGDGVYEKSTLFVDGLAYPTGTLPWRGGVLVTCAPDLFYAEDWDGDGKADKREVLFTGFTQGNPQHLVNGLSWGLDNWVYGANGDSGGTVKSTKTGKSVSISGRDFRCRPDTGEFEAVAGMSQFGRTRNDAGDWFGCNNVNPIWHFPLDTNYLKRNPHVSPPGGAMRVDVPKEPGSSPVYAISRMLPRFNDYHTADRFTSACSVHVYRDDLIPTLPPPFVKSSWVHVCEPVHNLVNRQLMQAKGMTFTSERAPSEQKSEFLASSDNYFRPVTVTTGPDGAIYIADMYRLVMEHPEWIPKSWQEKLNLRAGENTGRIYRVSPVHAKPRAVPRLDKMTAQELVGALDSPNGWQRDRAHMMLLWRGDKAVVPWLQRLVSESRNSLARLHSLCVLEGLGGLTNELIRSAVGDEDAGVRRHAVRLFSGQAQRDARVLQHFLDRVPDSDPKVRLQFAYAAATIVEPLGTGVLGGLAAEGELDPFMTVAVLSSLNAGNLEGFVEFLSESPKWRPPSVTLLSGVIQTAVGLGRPEALAPLLSRVTSSGQGKYEPWQFEALASLLEALERAKTPLTKLVDGKQLKEAPQRVAEVMNAARASLRDDSANVSLRVAAMGLLLRDPDARQEDLKIIREALSPQSSPELKSAAVSILGKRRDSETAPLLLAALKSFSPDVRGQALDVLLSRREWTGALLDAIERKELSAGDLDASRRQRLLQSPVTAIRERAEKLLAEKVNPDRQRVIDAYGEVTKLKGDPVKGKAVFGRACATCHRAGGEGHAVGPEFAAIGDKSTPGLLIAILDPNRAVEPRYLNYIMDTTDGDTHTGILISELEQAVKLMGPDGYQVSVSRRQVKDVRAGKTSLMPDGLEASVSVGEMADLIAFIQGVK